MQVILRTVEGEGAKLQMGDRYFKPKDTIPCLRCGTCCIKWQPEIGADELHALAAGLGISLETFLQEYVYPCPMLPHTYLLKREKDACIFLCYEERLASCAIHPFKPTACRNWTPSLSRPECRKGLRKRGGDDHLLLPQEVYPSSTDLLTLCRSLLETDAKEDKALL